MATRILVNEPVCVLHSGGIDSTAVVVWYLSRKIPVIPLYINYGNKTADTEWQVCKRISGLLKTEKPIYINAPINHLLPNNELVSKKKSVIREKLNDQFAEEFFPNRNLYLITIASIYCYQNNINSIALGIIDGGDIGYPDTDSYFRNKANSLLKHTLGISVHAPIITWSKQKVIRYLNQKKFDIDITYSCNTKANTPCGKCASCREREIALYHAN